MPLGADWMFAVGVRAGRRSLRTAPQPGVGVLAGWLLLRLVRLAAPRLPALASVAVFASAPLAFLVTGSLFSETLWCAFLLGTLLAALAWLRSRAPADLAALMPRRGRRIAGKATASCGSCRFSAIRLLVAQRGRCAGRRRRARVAVGRGRCAGAWPYANAGWRTGNPVFPFLNAVFRSPLFSSDARSPTR